MKAPTTMDQVANIVECLSVQLDSASDRGERELAGVIERARRVRERLLALAGTAREQDAARELAALEEEMTHIITGFQFYDLLRQKLAHMAEALHLVADHIEYRGGDPRLDCSLTRAIDGIYTLEEEKRVFRALLGKRGCVCLEAEPAGREPLPSPPERVEFF